VGSLPRPTQERDDRRDERVLRQHRGYAAPGTFDVTLTVTYADGERASKTIQVTAS
jgi:hypothetical protein